MYFCVKCTNANYLYIRYYPVSTDIICVWNPQSISFSCYFFIIFSRKIYNLSVP